MLSIPGPNSPQVAIARGSLRYIELAVPSDLDAVIARHLSKAVITATRHEQSSSPAC
jgi:hypothetical protein